MIYDKWLNIKYDTKKYSAYLHLYHFLWHLSMNNKICETEFKALRESLNALRMSIMINSQEE